MSQLARPRSFGGGDYPFSPIQCLHPGEPSIFFGVRVILVSLSESRSGIVVQGPLRIAAVRDLAARKGSRSWSGCAIYFPFRNQHPRSGRIFLPRDEPNRLFMMRTSRSACLTWPQRGSRSQELSRAGPRSSCSLEPTPPSSRQLPHPPRRPRNAAGSLGWKAGRTRGWRSPRAPSPSLPSRNRRLRGRGGARSREGGGQSPA
mmetsp:Transcript_16632/g.52052  ORF Transcript_16632/g.52052 Transcript_16632/m.52052 type:complete len:203 (-) Transcript_16632:248-856(-)